MKNYSKAAKLKAKKNKMPELAPTPKREANGCFVERTRQQEPEPRQTVWDARKRKSGGKDDIYADALSEPAGQAIYLTKGADEAKSLWAVFVAYRGATERYFRQRVQASAYPKIAKLDMVPERFDSQDAEMRDLRDEDTKHRDAQNKFNEWCGHLRGLPDAQAAIIKQVALVGGADLISQKEGMRQNKKGEEEWCSETIVTHAGRRFVYCMTEFAKVIDKKG